MSYHGEMHKKAEADLEVARREMEQRNLKHMEELAKQQPTPTIEELQRAMGVNSTPDMQTDPPAKEEPKPEEPKPVEPKPEEPKEGEDKVAKTSTAAPSEPKGGYNTRASSARK